MRPAPLLAGRPAPLRHQLARECLLLLLCVPLPGLLLLLLSPLCGWAAPACEAPKGRRPLQV
jgi:hypothetical protein